MVAGQVVRKHDLELRHRSSSVHILASWTAQREQVLRALRVFLVYTHHMASMCERKARAYQKDT